MTGVLRAATRKGLFSVCRSGNGWEVSKAQFLGDNCSAVLSHPVTGALYVALDHGHFGVKLHRSVDGGENFEEIATPAYAEQSEDEPPWQDMHGRIVPNALQLIWSLEAGHPSQGSRLWCGTIPGGLFRSDDGGDSWQLVESLWTHPARRKWFGGGMDFPGIHTISVHPQNSADLTIAVSCGGIWRSTDDGASWKSMGRGLRAEYMPPEIAADPEVQDVHRLDRCRDYPDVLWVQDHNGIFRSEDAGENWSEIGNVSPSAFGFAVVAHPLDPETAWFVPEIKDERRIPVDGKLVVTRTRDGGRSFQLLDSGLPGAHAYDIVFRHAFDQHVDGQYLAMGSTTGSLWVSENGGENWFNVSAHLPPVYALRFDP